MKPQYKIDQLLLFKNNASPDFGRVSGIVYTKTGYRYELENPTSATDPHTTIDETDVIEAYKVVVKKTKAAKAAKTPTKKNKTVKSAPTTGDEQAAA